jgi:hypothetical protein
MPKAKRRKKKDKWKVEFDRANLNVFPPNWYAKKSTREKCYQYRGADGKIILPFSFVKVDFSYASPKYRQELRKTYPWKEGTLLLFICEVRFSGGHCMIYDFDKKELSGVWHTCEFRMCTEDEV